MGSSDELLYLEDLHVGRRFTSGVHTLDESQINAFANAFDPQPFHLDEEAARRSLLGGLAASGWHTAAITMRLNVTGGLPIAGVHRGPRRTAHVAQGRCVRATSFTSKARSSRSFRRTPDRTAEPSWCAARPGTNAASWCKPLR
jgi:acyl dehydratase